MATTKIAIDAMGGDVGLEVTVPASLKALDLEPELHLILVGDQARVQQCLNRHGGMDHERISIQHASQEIAMDESPSQALRTKKDSSMRVAIDLVKQGQAQACVSAGNTGALMATARFVLKTLPGVDRPAIIAAFPTGKSGKPVRMLDLGANVDSCADHLYQFAVMASVLVSALDNNPRPEIGLLNIGEEEMKGNDQVKRTAQLLAESDKLNYIGYVEGDHIFTGTADVVVCDGFVGNVALKAIEGAVKLIAEYAKQEFKRSPLSWLSALCAMPVLKRLKKRLDPGHYNGASLLGLNGIVIKSHGGADVKAFAHAIMEAVLEVKNNIPERIRAQVGILLEESE